MPFLQRDDVQLYYEVKGQGRPFVFISETACALARDVHGARLVILPGERHSCFFANPEAAHKAIREFL